MPNKKYRVDLIKDERSRLLKRLGRGERPAAEQTRVRVLLKVDEGPDGPAWTDGRTAEALEGRSPWSLRLLADKMVELGVVEDLSHETVRQTL
jgi:hypothetical protein